MKKLFALIVGLTFLLITANDLWAVIKKIDGRKCDGVAALTQGGPIENYWIQGPGVDLTTGLSVSNSALTATIVRKWNGGQNQADGGNILWGKIQIRVNASASAPVGNHTVTIKYPIGKDTFTVRVIRRASITRASVQTFSEPFYGNVDVRLIGTGLKNARLESVRIKRDAYNPLLDSSGQEVPPLSSNVVYVTGLVNTATNTDAQVDVRLTFSQSLPRLTKTTIVFNFAYLGGCSGFPATYTLTLMAPKGGPNYVSAHDFDRVNRSYRIGDVVTITIRLDRPVSISGVPITSPPSLRKSPTRQQALGETVYWAVIPSNAVQQGGASGAPYNPNLRYNQITIPVRQQSKAITFQISRCTAGGNINTMKFVTWKPNPNNDLVPNRKETNFTVSCNQ